MIQLLVVGDGPRDRSALPKLICRLLDSDAEVRYDDWHDVRYLKGKGDIHARKVMYLTRRARVDKFIGLAVVVDTDKSSPRHKLRALRQGRDEDRQKSPPFPTALGEANPHFDIWLLDDPVAIREALGLSGDFEIPNAIRVSYPKNELSSLVNDSDVDFDEVSDALGEIATRVVLNRCAHRNDTGFAAFADDVDAELRPLVG